MEWADEPATWRQIKSLKELGHTLDHRLTKTEAADLIRSLGGRVPAEPAFVSESVPKPRQMDMVEALRDQYSAIFADNGRNNVNSHERQSLLYDTDENREDNPRDAGNPESGDTLFL